MGTAVIFAGGPTPVVTGSGRVATVLERVAADLVVAADSGLDLAVALGWRCHLVVGDMDSVSPTALAAAERDGAEIRRHPQDKESTDLDLAMTAAMAAGVDRVVVIGSDSGRMDHLLAAPLTLAAARYAGLRVEGWLGGALVVPVHSCRVVDGAPGRILSILAVHGSAHGVSTSGLRWPLESETLESGSSRGVSNEFLGTSAEVSVDQGTVIVVVPATEEES